MRRPLAAVAVVLAVAATATACNDNTKPADPAATGKGPAAQAPSAPAQGQGDGKSGAVGGKVTVKGNKPGEQLDVTLKNWADPAKSDNKYTPPKPGKKYVAAEFEIVNTGTAPYADSPQNSASVIDAQGQKTNASTLASVAEGASLGADLKLAAGQKATGWIVFTVPENDTVKTVQFAMNSGLASQPGQWAVKK
ncbi:DUF4352 domain-containing protein [Streptomyces morookaense]|uniref:DUF4352 domain-containing protein n=1 Tax=Streptomyces morookaense TaxID=1970 RepID=UPI0033F63812